MTNLARLSSCAIVFVTADVRKTSVFYRDVLGFQAVEHFDHAEPFAAMYRGGVEIVLVQASFGQVRSNQATYGAGFDAYLVVNDVEQDVDALCAEFRERGAQIIEMPAMSPYGNYQFVVADCDGRWLAVGKIREEDVFFKDQRPV